MRNKPLRPLVSVCIVGSLIGMATLVMGDYEWRGEWRMFGQDLNNSASSPDHVLSPGNVGGLAPRWVFTTGGDVSARPAVADGIVYFPDWGGNLWALHARSGAVVWHHAITDYGLPAGTISRASPALDDDTLYLGTQKGAYLLALSKQTGALRWKTQLDTHPYAVLTSSPVLHRGAIYIGVSSLEEGAAADPGYPCCTFRGSAMAVDANSGAAIWKSYMAPAGYSGSAIWASTAVIDEERNLAVFTTGNNYNTPTDPAYAACIAAGGTEGACLSKDDHVDSVVALSLSNGAVRWAQRLSNGDDWNVACAIGDPGGTGNCPTGSGSDYDFGAGANRLNVRMATGEKTLIGAGQKSGIYSAFDVSDGKLVWATQVGPGSSLGGIQWGSATDGRRIYVAISNFAGSSYPGGDAGSFSALDPATGSILWQTPDPNGSFDMGPLTVANGVVYAPSMAGGAAQSNMFALDAGSGAIKWSFASGGSVLAGAAVVDGVVYWGSGYSNLGIPGFSGNNKFYAFSLGGR